MQDRYWLYQRGNGVYYIQDRVTGRQSSLKTKDKATAENLFNARNQAAQTPAVNVAIARAYLTAKSPDLLNRTWDDVMAQRDKAYVGSSLVRWGRVKSSAPFQLLRKLPLLETDSSHFLAVLNHAKAGNSTNRWLRTLHNLALDLGWLLAPVLHRKAWPKIRMRRGKAITWEQHRRLVETSRSPEIALYLEMLWETGGSQTDIARLQRDNVDGPARRLTYQRQKLASRDMGKVVIAIGTRLQELLDKLPASGALFPNLALQSENARASRFRQRCHSFGFDGITLHSYRYAWAQRAKAAGMPLREAMAHLGHGSRVVHFIYSEEGEAVTLPLEYYEKQRAAKVIEFHQSLAPAAGSEATAQAA